MAVEQAEVEARPSERFLEAMRKAMAKKPGLPPDAIYGAPSDGYFAPVGLAEQDYLPAPDLEAIGSRLIAEYDELAHLIETPIAWLWKRDGGTHQGQVVLGKCVKPSGLAKHFAGVTWIIWLAADHCNAYSLTRRQVEAALLHELSHAGEEETDDGERKPIVIGHDWEGFSAEVARYGAWREGLMLCRNAWQQLSLGLE